MRDMGSWLIVFKSCHTHSHILPPHPRRGAIINVFQPVTFNQFHSYPLQLTSWMKIFCFSSARAYINYHWCPFNKFHSPAPGTALPPSCSSRCHTQCPTPPFCPTSTRPQRWTSPVDLGEDSAKKWESMKIRSGLESTQACMQSSWNSSTTFLHVENWRVRKWGQKGGDKEEELQDSSWAPKFCYTFLLL